MRRLALAGAAVEAVEMLARIVVRAGLGGHVEVRLDHVGHVAQDGGRTLLRAGEPFIPWDEGLAYQTYQITP